MPFLLWTCKNFVRNGDVMVMMHVLSTVDSGLEHCLVKLKPMKLVDVVSPQSKQDERVR